MLVVVRFAADANQQRFDEVTTKMNKKIVVAMFVALSLVCGMSLNAQIVTTYYPPAIPQPVTTYYAPSAVAAPAEAVTTYYAPSAVAAPSPTVTYYSPAPQPVTTYYAPQPVTVVPAPTTTYYAPAVPTTTYYAPVAPMIAPTTVYRAPVLTYDPTRLLPSRRWSWLSP